MDTQIGKALELIMAVSDNENRENSRSKVEREIGEAKEAIDKIAEFS
jgi:hypothetical protein